MIDKYPRFSKLQFEHRKMIEEFSGRFEPYSDFNFVSLYSWNIDDSTEVSLLNDNLIIKLPDYLDGTPVISILGENKIDESVKELLDSNLSLKLIPQTVVSHLSNPEAFGIIEDEDNHDYIYDMRSHLGLSGGKFKKKRNKLNNFVDNYGEKTVVNRINRKEETKIHELQEVFRQWAHERQKENDEIENEQTAIARMLDRLDHFNLEVYEILIGDEIVGFSVNEILPSKFLVSHFQKSLLRYKHIDTYLTNVMTKKMLEKGCIYANWEQDLGVDGIRTLKRSYKPVKMLKKYMVL